MVFVNRAAEVAGAGGWGGLGSRAVQTAWLPGPQRWPCGEKRGGAKDNTVPLSADPEPIGRSPEAAV